MTVVAYLISSHTRPEQVLRLLRTIRTLSPDAPILLHHDGRREPLDRRLVSAIGGVELIPPEPAVEWARASQLEMLLRCWRHARRRGGFDWLSAISGQDYPARPLDLVERELAETPYDAFVEGRIVDPPSLRREPIDEFARRYFYAWRRVRSPGRISRRAVIALRPALMLRELPSAWMLGVRVRTPFTAAAPCRRGSGWLTLSRRAVEALDDAARDRPRLLRHFRRTIFPDEAYAPTVLHAAPDLRLSGDMRRYLRFDPGSRSPATLRLADLDAIAASGTDFARKFDMRVDAAVLDALDAHLGI